MLQGVAADCNSAGRKPTLGSIPRRPTKKHTGVSNKAMLVLAADCNSVPEEAGCSIQHTPTKFP